MKQDGFYNMLQFHDDYFGLNHVWVAYFVYGNVNTMTCSQELKQILMIPLNGLQVDVRNGSWMKQDGYYHI